MNSRSIGSPSRNSFCLLACTGLLVGCGAADDSSSTAEITVESLRGKPSRCQAAIVTTTTPMPCGIDGQTLAATHPEFVRASDTFDFTLEVRNFTSADFPAPYTSTIVGPTVAANVSGATPALWNGTGNDIPFTQGQPIPVWAHVTAPLTVTGTPGSDVEIDWTNFAYTLAVGFQNSCTAPAPVPVATIPIALPLARTVADCSGGGWRSVSGCDGRGLSSQEECVRFVRKHR